MIDKINPFRQDVFETPIDLGIPFRLDKIKRIT